MMNHHDILMATEPVTQAFDALHIPYYIGGSVASSTYGMARATMDVDIVADIIVAHIRPFIKQLEQSYYLDEGMIVNAIARKSSFNLIHLETMIKVDIFVSDVVMPNMDGPAMAKQARAKYPDLPVLFMSGYAEEQLRKSIDLDNVAFLPKPFSVAQIAEAVGNILAEHAK